MPTNDLTAALSEEEQQQLEQEARARPIRYPVPVEQEIEGLLDTNVLGQHSVGTMFHSWYYCVKALASRKHPWRLATTIQQLPSNPLDDLVNNPSQTSRWWDPQPGTGLKRQRLYPELGQPSTGERSSFFDLAPRPASLSDINRATNFSSADNNQARTFNNALFVITCPPQIPVKYFYYKVLRDYGPFIFNSFLMWGPDSGLKGPSTWRVLTGLQVTDEGWLADYFTFKTAAPNDNVSGSHIHLVTEKNKYFFRLHNPVITTTDHGNYVSNSYLDLEKSPETVTVFLFKKYTYF